MEPWSVKIYSHTTGRETQYDELTFFASIYLRVVSATGSDSKGVGENTPIEELQSSAVVQVPVNMFTGRLEGILRFTSTQVWILVENRYDIQESALY